MPVVRHLSHFVPISVKQKPTWSHCWLSWWARYALYNVILVYYLMEVLMLFFMYNGNLLHTLTCAVSSWGSVKCLPFAVTVTGGGSRHGDKHCSGDGPLYPLLFGDSSAASSRQVIGENFLIPLHLYTCFADWVGHLDRHSSWSLIFLLLSVSCIILYPNIFIYCLLCCEKNTFIATLIVLKDVKVLLWLLL